MNTKLFVYAIAVVLFSCLLTHAAELKGETSLQDSVEIKRIKQTIVQSYVEGIFLKGDYKLVKKGWHPDCDIVVLENEKLVKLPASYWVKRLKKSPQPLDPSVTYSFSDVRVTGYAAIASVEIFSQGKHLYTDYMCLYKFDDKWQIVTKIYYTHHQ